MTIKRKQAEFFKLDTSGDLEKGWYWEVGNRRTGPFNTKSAARKDAKAEGFAVAPVKSGADAEQRDDVGAPA